MNGRPGEGERVYMVSGGLGYLGRLVTKALMAEGAGKVVLLSSSRSELSEDWDVDGEVVVERCDVGNREEVERVVQKHGKVRGVVHSAGVLADRTVGELTREDFDRVYGPKVDGARHLAACTRKMGLEFFVMFSSIASGIGMAGQANYAAANGCLDALATELASEGVRALSVRWGGGMAMESTIRRIGQMGLLPVSAEQGMGVLMEVMRRPPGPVVTVCPMDGAKLPSSPYFDEVRGGAKEVKGEVETVTHSHRNTP